MTNAFLFLSIMAAILFLVAYRQGKHLEGLKEAKTIFINALPILLCVFIIIGFIEILLPKELLQGWLGEGAGVKGLILGTVVGALIQGGPFIFFPLFDALFRESVTTGTAVAMITAWGMINVGHLPYELTFLGPRFVALKYALYIGIPCLAGSLADLISAYIFSLPG